MACMGAPWVVSGHIRGWSKQPRVWKMSSRWFLYRWTSLALKEGTANKKSLLFLQVTMYVKNTLEYQVSKESTNKKTLSQNANYMYNVTVPLTRQRSFLQSSFSCAFLTTASAIRFRIIRRLSSQSTVMLTPQVGQAMIPCCSYSDSSSSWMASSSLLAHSSPNKWPLVHWYTLPYKGWKTKHYNTWSFSYSNVYFFLLSCWRTRGHNGEGLPGIPTQLWHLPQVRCQGLFRPQVLCNPSLHFQSIANSASTQNQQPVNRRRL